MSCQPGGSVQQQVAQLLADAATLLRAGQAAEAIAPLTEASDLQPHNAIIQHDLGLACLEAGRQPEAVAALRRAVSCDPQYADAYFRLGIALEQLGDSRSAIAAYDRATALQPSLTEAWFRAGALVHSMGHIREAIGCFRRAASSKPKSALGRLGAARVLLAEERSAEAERHLRAMLSADQGNAEAHDLLGNLLAESGRFEEARKSFTQAVAGAPHMAGSYYDLVRCRPVTAADGALVARIRDALSTPGLETESRLRVHLALGKAADDLGDYQLAMQHFDAADALRPMSVAFDCDVFESGIDRLIEATAPSVMARAPQLGSRNQTPILIVGMPRSGTTLVEQIVASHPSSHGAGELNFWNECGAAWLKAGAGGTEAKFLRDAATDYLRLLKSVGRKSVRVTDKMPFNFLWAGLIHLAFPQAVIIHCRRAAIDTALSIHQTLFHSNLAFPTGGAKLVRYFRSYEKLTSHWRQVLPPDRFVEVSYEDLTRDPASEIRRIIACCGLPWDEACLHPERNPRPVKTPSKWQTRQPIYRNSVERWRRYEAWLGPLSELRAWGAD